MSEELRPCPLTELPERILAWVEEEDAPNRLAGLPLWCDVRSDAGRDESNADLYLRADTAIPKAEADAMVAAAYEAARNAAICAKSDYAAPTARIDIANAIDKLAAAAIRAQQETSE